MILSPALEQLISVFLEENTRLNLSALRTETAVREKHIQDSLRALPFLKGATNILDIGTGGGFPALPLAIALPKTPITALDSTKKKLEAIARMAKKLRCQNLKVLFGRAGEKAHDPLFREKYSVVVSRAALPYPALLEIGAAFLQKGGLLMAFRGKTTRSEEHQQGKKFGLFFREQDDYILPGGEMRSLWIFEKKSSTPGLFPRLWIDIKKDLNRETTLQKNA